MTPPRSWHALPAATIFETLATRDTGLDEAEAARRLERDGPNQLTRRRGTSMLRALADQFVQPLVIVLIAAAVVSAVLGDHVDAIVIGGVVVVNGLIGFFQERRAHQAIAALDQLIVTEATVVRDGKPHRVRSAELVVGDLVRLQSGDAVPADLRLIQVRDLQVEEAALTGESVPVGKAIGELPEDTALGDRTNLAFGGTIVTYGQAGGIVVAVGDATETGKIADLMASTQTIATPLTRRIAALSRMLVWLILGLATAMFLLEAARGSALSTTFNAAVALAVGAIPEGLPAAVTIMLAVGVSRMARRRALDPPPARGRDPRQHDRDLLRQDRHADREPDDGHRAGRRRRGVRGHGHRLRAGRRRSRAAASPSIRRPRASLREALLGRSAVQRHASRPHRRRAGRWWSRRSDRGRAAGRGAQGGARRRDARGVAAPRRGAVRVASTCTWRRCHDGPDGPVVYVKGASEALLARCVDQLAADGTAAPIDAEAARAEVDGSPRGGCGCCAWPGGGRTTPGRSVTSDVGELTLLGLVGMIDPAAPRGAARGRRLPWRRDRGSR